MHQRLDPVRALAWRIECSSDLNVTIVVAEQYILLLSVDATTAAPWRLGTYMSEEEAQRRAVEMTGSYERMRKGVVGEYAVVLLPRPSWEHTVKTGVVSAMVGGMIAAALNVSPILSTTDD